MCNTKGAESDDGRTFVDALAIEGASRCRFLERSLPGGMRCHKDSMSFSVLERDLVRMRPMRKSFTPRCCKIANRFWAKSFKSNNFLRQARAAARRATKRTASKKDHFVERPDAE